MLSYCLVLLSLETYQCPGAYKCHGHRHCVQLAQVCDGIEHCPEKDDELFCGMKALDGNNDKCSCSKFIIGYDNDNDNNVEEDDDDDDDDYDDDDDDDDDKEITYFTLSSLILAEINTFKNASMC